MNRRLLYWIIMVSLLPMYGNAAVTDAQGNSNTGTVREESGQVYLGMPHSDVPYVPTSDRVITEMLKVANVSQNDIVYDLGCGDGRIVITAAKKTGARGVGVDMDPERIRESKENAAKAKVTDRVTFLQQDLFKTDFRKATVLALYLLPNVNRRLRPRILNELKPGTRIVSHDFDMGEWQPDNISDISSRDTVYFWVVPANVSGTWQLTAPGINGGEPYTLSLTQKFQKVVATLKAGNAQIPVKDVKLIGDRLEFVAEMNVNGNPVRRRFTGKTDGDTMKGVFEPDEAGRENTWQAERDPSTAVLLEEPGGAGEKNNRF